MRTLRILTICAMALSLFSCGEADRAPASAAAPPPFAADLLFHANFENGAEAAFSKGDRMLYSVEDYGKLEERRQGLDGETATVTTVDPDFGQSLRFLKRQRPQVFLFARDNVAFSPDGWNGTISFWLRVDPVNELEPGFTDPIQITDAAYDDTCIWVDFTKDVPRDFRLGVFGNNDSWKPKDVPTGKAPEFEARLITVKNPPFSGDSWTHVVITHEALGTPNGRTALYVNGEKQSDKSGIADAFQWEMEKATIRLGVNFVGTMDELAIFRRALSEDEIRQLRAMRGKADFTAKQ